MKGIDQLIAEDPNASGNRVIDALALRGRMERVWHQLEFKYPEIKAVGMALWHARRDGRLRRVITGHDKFIPIRTALGPETDEEWDLLRDAALLAIEKKRY